MNNFVAGGCDPMPSLSSRDGGDDVAGLLGAVGGLTHAAISGNLGGALKGMAIEQGKKLATALLMKLFTIKPAPKPPKPPWPGLGKIAPPGSALAAAAIAAYKSVHKAPPAAGGSASGTARKSGGDAWCQDPNLANNDPNDRACRTDFHPNGSAASFEQWAEYLTGSKDPRVWADLGITPWNYLEFDPLTEPWWASLLGGSMDEGYSMLWGLVQLGSPKYPGAGTHDIWWIPDELFGYDMSNLYAPHDANAIMGGGPSEVPAAALNELRIYLQAIAAARDPLHVALTVAYCTILFPVMIVTVATDDTNQRVGHHSGMRP